LKTLEGFFEGATAQSGGQLGIVVQFAKKAAGDFVRKRSTPIAREPCSNE